MICRSMYVTHIIFLICPEGDLLSENNAGDISINICRSFRDALRFIHHVVVLLGSFARAC